MIHKMHELKIKSEYFQAVWDDGVQCLASKGLWMDYDGKHQACPLVPVPAHGRLIDADALAEYVCQQSDWLSETAIHTFRGTLRKAPTIIPAEPLNEEVNE